ncbi:MAG: hypothetical protein H0T58_00080 [Gemmatimonadales bacterium]|nr:hypothetical protein [Gemmatimonadales bacterium]
MARVTDQLAQAGMGTLVAGLKAVQSGVSKKKYKRLIATAVAQLLTMHPDFGAGQARRRARKVVGAKPARKMLVKRGRAGLKEGLETAAVAAAGGAALKVASKLGRKVTEKLKDAVETAREDGAGTSTRQA